MTCPSRFISAAAAARVAAFAAALCCAAVPALAGPDIAYKSGGVGLQESRALKQEAAQYSTSVTFSTASGEYLANVKVSIKAQDGSSVLDTVSEGPILLVNLPAGEYTLTAEIEGRSASRRLSVPAHGHRDLVIQL